MEGEDPSVCFTFRGAEILCRPDGSPCLSRLPECGSAAGFRAPDGSFAAVKTTGEPKTPDGHGFAPVRSLVGTLPPDELRMVLKALGTLNWLENNRYCGRCASPMADKADETARSCPECGSVIYPKISPAILALVRRGDRILLARNANFKSGIHSLVAGFVEQGENFEECVAREVHEEVGLSVYNIRYRGSQPWPFPDSLMVGFEAECPEGDIVPDGVEIVEAGWYGPNDHPPLPMPGSLSRALIDGAFESIRGLATRSSTAS